MKILHIIAGDLSGGAAKGAYNLHKALIASGESSHIYNNTLSKNDDAVSVSINSNKKRVLELLKRKMEALALKFYPKRIDRIFSMGFVGFDFIKTNEYKNADIIHLHWINGSFVNMKTLANIDKPIVWTIRDMWPLTGGCHYSLDCTRYTANCGGCPQLGSNTDYDLSRIILKRKMKYLPHNLTAVGISSWVSEILNKSTLFKNKRVVQINNCIDTKDFFPIEKAKAREVLGIKTDKKILLMGANSVTDFYKGFDKCIESLKKLDTEKYFLLFFGNLDESCVIDLGFEYKSMGYISDVISLRLIYSSATIFIAPSIMEAFGKTLIESMACKTPVVCFNATGPKDIVTHKFDGYKAKPFCTTSLANGIEWVVHNDNYEELCERARGKVVTEFDSVVVAKQYIHLYKDVLNE